MAKKPRKPDAESAAERDGLVNDIPLEQRSDDQGREWTANDNEHGVDENDPSIDKTKPGWRTGRSKPLTEDDPAPSRRSGR